MIVIRVMEIQLTEKEEEFVESRHLFLLCWMHVLMLSGATFHLVGCFHQRHRL